VQSQRWKRIGELFAAARVLDNEQRIEFLKQNCTDDPGLVQEVATLLKVDDTSGLLDYPILSSTFPVPPVIAGRFKIIRPLGEGGMGIVYEAEDLRLEERVALKTIRAEIATNSNALERFKREVLLGKRVTHPNVCRIHDLGLHRLENGRDLLFLTMQFLRGETLASLIKRGPMLETEASPFVQDMLAALSAAHEVGVIHRDFKSGNVMLVGSANRVCAVVTDFGLARCIHDDGTLTNGSFVGTVDYMAPEQIRGAEISPATDIYSLGIVMYEMVTGTRPFKGDSQISIAMQHLKEEPIPPQNLAPQLQDNWNETILVCLRKDPAERFQSAQEVKTALIPDITASKKMRLTGLIGRRTLVSLISVLIFALVLGVLSVTAFRHTLTPSTQQNHSVAVLPFRESGQTPQYFSFGFTEEVMNALSKVPGLRVIGPESSFRFSTSDLSPMDIGKRLSAHYLLYGSVNHIGGQVHVVIRIVDSIDGSQLWSHEISRSEGDVLLLSDDIARSVSSELGIGLGGTELSGKSIDANGLTARDLYWTGRFLFHQRSDGAVQTSLQYFRQSVKNDPNFAEGYCGIADTLFVLAERGLLSPKVALLEARQAARRAVELNKRLPAAYVSLAQITSVYDRDLDEAERLFRFALRLDSRLAPAWQWLAYQMVKERRFPEAVRAAQEAVASDPLSTAANINLLVIFYYAGLDDMAMRQSRKLAQIDPKSPLPSFITAEVFARRGLTSEAIHELESISEEQQQNPVALRVAVEIYAKAGKQQLAQQALDRLLNHAGQGGVPPSYLAIAYAAMGNNDEAFTWLKRACDDLDPFASIADAYPAFEEMRSDARWAPLMTQLGIKEKTPLNSSALMSRGVPTIRALLGPHTDDQGLGDAEETVGPAQTFGQPEYAVRVESNRPVMHQALAA
jgi:eukaryotic-like serine/threonine-protein kinase